MSAVSKPTSSTTAKSARLIVDGKEVELPVIVGTEDEKAINIHRFAVAQATLRSTMAT